ncbi:lipoyl(octanoyl) transferase LipB [Pontibacter sp. G13]|uniref:lipoyl(octanoyl) transferase LipB n=1 Tax=Pontibacter sp. G13 TaxID=3074898 RepID=UPI00288A6FFF|nr:lipoyl(octanoyl) transferase LipB [Pontibacter sp. G13]WNJ16580.1 lipoyl(octanoyl) transferase LipB [Pontibacter sp. G13]
MLLKSFNVEKVNYEDLGRIAYQEAWDLQESLLRVNVGMKLAAGNKAKPSSVSTKNYLLFCEHNPVFTLGKSGKADHLLIQEDRLKAQGIEFFKINRGGDITFHGPGQITGYPILDLEKFKPDIHWYLRTMEDVMIRLLADYGLKGGRIDGATGVWVDVDSPRPRKICAMGVRCSRWVTMHGFAFNVNTDLQYFDMIVPCGISDKGVTSLAKELGHEVSMDEVKAKLVGHFADLFEMSIPARPVI